MSYLTSFMSCSLISFYHILSYLSNLVFSYIILSYFILPIYTISYYILKIFYFTTVPDKEGCNYSLFLSSYCFICISYQFLFYMHLCLTIFYTSNLLLILLSFDHLLLLLLQSPYIFFLIFYHSFSLLYSSSSYPIISFSTSHFYFFYLSLFLCQWCWCKPW